MIIRVSESHPCNNWLELETTVKETTVYSKQINSSKANTLLNLKFRNRKTINNIIICSHGHRQCVCVFVCVSRSGHSRSRQPPEELSARSHRLLDYQSCRPRPCIVSLLFHILSIDLWLLIGNFHTWLKLTYIQCVLIKKSDAEIRLF